MCGLGVPFPSPTHDSWSRGGEVRGLTALQVSSITAAAAEIDTTSGRMRGNSRPKKLEDIADRQARGGRGHKLHCGQFRKPYSAPSLARVF